MGTRQFVAVRATETDNCCVCGKKEGWLGHVQRRMALLTARISRLN